MSFESLLALLVQYGYWIIFVGILLDNAGLPLPGELFLLAFGAVARTEPAISTSASAFSWPGRAR